MNPRRRRPRLTPSRTTLLLPPARRSRKSQRGGRGGRAGPPRRSASSDKTIPQPPEPSDFPRRRPRPSRFGIPRDGHGRFGVVRRRPASSGVGPPCREPKWDASGIRRAARASPRTPWARRPPGQSARPSAVHPRLRSRTGRSAIDAAGDRRGNDDARRRGARRRLGLRVRVSVPGRTGARDGPRSRMERRVGGSIPERRSSHGAVSSIALGPSPRATPAEGLRRSGGGAERPSPGSWARKGARWSAVRTPGNGKAGRVGSFGPDPGRTATPVVSTW